MPRKDANSVINLMRERKKSGNKPGERKDKSKLALVIEGGGMRGIVSAGMVAAIEQLGYLDTIDAVYGTSAGALNGAFLLSGQASWSCTLYYDYLNEEKFLDFNRLLLGKPAIDTEWLANEAYAKERRLNYDAILASPISFHCMATEIESGKSVNLTDFSSKDEVESALLAASRIPFLGGDPHEHEGEKYIDGAMTEPIPLEAASSDGATHILILQTRPEGLTLKQSIFDPLVERYLQEISPALADLYEERAEKYERVQRYIDSNVKSDNHVPAIASLKLPQGSVLIGSFEKNKDKLIQAAGSGLKLMQEQLTGNAVVVEQVIQAFPAAWYDDIKSK